MCSMILAGCQSLPSDTPDRSADTSRAVGLEREPEWLNNQVKPREYADIWERVRDGFKLQDEIGINPRIERVRLWYASNPKHVNTVSERSAPYIHYIVERLAERDMPMELALLPVIESAYDPLAYSSAHAVGLWQFIPSTGRHYNLRQTNWYDGRRDVTASTEAALNYLSRLHEMFNGDWLLALAAYNAGEGRISRAIERNEKLGLPSDYWNLSLPKETEDYVPKLLALSQVILTPEAYSVSLSPIANEPYFEQIAIKQHMDLSRVAKLADLDEQELLQLNPAYKRGITLDGPQHLLVPTDKAEMLSANLALMKPQEMVDWQSYTVRSGDSLHAIANRHHLSVNMLKDVNRLSGNNLSIGQVLPIPAKPGAQPSEPLYQQRSVAQSASTRNLSGKERRQPVADRSRQPGRGARPEALEQAARQCVESRPGAHTGSRRQRRARRQRQSQHRHLTRQGYLLPRKAWRLTVCDRQALQYRPQAPAGLESTQQQAATRGKADPLSAVISAC